MYCPQCGTRVLPEHVFCGHCGARLSGAGGAPAANPAGSPSPGTSSRTRISRHLSVLAILWIVFSMLRLVPALAMLAFSHTHFPFVFMPIPAHVRAFILPFIGMLGLVFSALGIAGVIAGWGLLTHQSWARALAIVVGIISLIHFPFGTALGIYTLWVLMAPEAGSEYLRLAHNH